MTRPPTQTHARTAGRRVTPRSGVRYSRLAHDVLLSAAGDLLAVVETVRPDLTVRYSLTVAGDPATGPAYLAFASLVVAGLVEVPGRPVVTPHGAGVLRRWNVEQGLVESTGCQS